MSNKDHILTDSFGRKHTYLRISITERCNLRCTYCMPAEGISLSPKEHLMTAEEIFKIAQLFNRYGVDKIRLTGGEPLVRKDVGEILESLGQLPVSLGITTNGILADRYIETFRRSGLTTINLSLDSLVPERNAMITRRDQFDKVIQNMQLLIREGFRVKLNCVLMKGINDMEITSFTELCRDLPLELRFIEFMPFDGNRWNLEKLVSMDEILTRLGDFYPAADLIKLEDDPHDTARHYKIKGHLGSFAIISTVSNPFCDGCNRIRLTANGKLKNCLFSNKETDLLGPLRAGESIEELIRQTIQSKLKVRNGMEDLSSFSDPDSHTGNRSMITIGG